jgi:DNA-binding transcriptional LysR family regulator
MIDNKAQEGVMAINELRSISIFASAAELGCLRKAAAAQGITPQAASQALAQLERHLDIRLFHRTTRVMSLTDEGRQFLEEAQPALRGLQRALESAKRAKEEIAGPLRIVGPRSTFQGVIWRLLEEFCQQYPGIVPDVKLEDRVRRQLS